MTTQMAVAGDFDIDCPFPPTVLDFLPLRGVDRLAVEERWPCEVRAYWVRDLRPFVFFVRFVFAYLTPFVVGIGLVLNCVALRVLCYPTLRDTSLAVYLRAISVSDMGALLCTYGLGYWRSHHKDFNSFFMKNPVPCRMHKVLVSMFPLTSQWLQIALTVERLIVVWRPMRLPNPGLTQSTRSARRAVVAVWIISVLVALPRWHVSGFEQYSAFEYPRCDMSSQNSVEAVYVYVALSTYLPGSLIFICNVMLLCRLRRSNANRRLLFAGTSLETDARADGAACTLLLFSLLYLALQLPLGVVETIELYWDISLYRPPATRGLPRAEYVSWLCIKLQLKWVRALLFWLFQLSFVLNFVVYLKSGRKFRLVTGQLASDWCSRLRRSVPYSVRNMEVRVRATSNDSSNVSTSSASSSGDSRVGLGVRQSRWHGHGQRRRSAPGTPCSHACVKRGTSCKHKRSKSRVRSWTDFHGSTNDGESHREARHSTDTTHSSNFSPQSTTSTTDLSSVFEFGINTTSHFTPAVRDRFISTPQPPPRSRPRPGRFFSMLDNPWEPADESQPSRHRPLQQKFSSDFQPVHSNIPDDRLSLSSSSGESELFSLHTSSKEGYFNPMFSSESRVNEVNDNEDEADNEVSGHSHRNVRFDRFLSEPHGFAKH